MKQATSSRAHLSLLKLDYHIARFLPKLSSKAKRKSDKALFFQECDSLEIHLKVYCRHVQCRVQGPTVARGPILKCLQLVVQNMLYVAHHWNWLIKQQHLILIGSQWQDNRTVCRHVPSRNYTGGTDVLHEQVRNEQTNSYSRHFLLCSRHGHRKEALGRQLGVLLSGAVES